MYEAVEDGIGQGGIADDVVPFFDGKLTGDQGRSGAVSILQYLQQIATMLCRQFGQSPIIEDDDIGLGQGGQELGVSPVALGDDHLLQQSGQTQIQGGIAFPTGLLREGTGQPGLADAGWSGEQDIEVLLDPLAAGQ